MYTLIIRTLVPFVLVYTTELIATHIDNLNTNFRIDNHLAGGLDLGVYFCFVLCMPCLLDPVKFLVACVKLLACLR